MSYKTLLSIVFFLLFVIFIGVIIIKALPLLITVSGNVLYLAGMLMILAVIIYGFIYFWKSIRK